ncbi:MAG: 3-methyl-2-oxobutanoate hydroxymethyltransferase [Dysgonamonadaceae bacterium]|nr:3-methyl-2-oxobutanoate hydroxymethyltransferase [Dysgonamonadaceae bacterium]MDD4245934.1 3-methyl-2-oxobutanoate hydroxymethyltransferase [Dysgonamonadaceae bacterium]MDD4604704.1 3-methyl-2-oxobutanoate hydroxymethyltransferase [Dysgonamonadaceae bacterium]HUI32326.1 3-methyl-2-oxobutanoate hydroxymethyltransferase [Dysgonamonadaceae bacterium]
MNKKFTIKSFQEAKEKKQPISMLTSYDYSMAKILDESGVDSLLVGDSLGMVFQGNNSTISVTLNDMIYHAKAVNRGAKRALVVVDMPFMSYHVSVEEAVRNAGRLMKEGGAEAVKLEGGTEYAETIRQIVRAQIPVMGHIGMTPQSVHMFGGFTVQGKSLTQAQKILDDAKALEKAGVFAIVLECVPELLTKLISETVNIPIIGIGAGKYCDGQVLVVNDMLGMFSDFAPKFVKQFTHLSSHIEKAVKTYIDEMNSGSFPLQEHTFTIDEEVINKLTK